MRFLIALLCMAVPLRAGLEFDFTRIDRRASPGDDKVVVEFPFKVTGDKAVKITKVKTSCGCTTAKLPKKVFAPGESSAITTTFKIGDRRGLQQKAIKVESNDPGNPKTILVLRTIISESVEFSRSILIWKRDAPPSPSTVEVKVIADDPINLVAVESSEPAFKTELVTIESGREYRLTVTPVSTAKKARAAIVLTADSPSTHPQTFGVRALIK